MISRTLRRAIIIAAVVLAWLAFAPTGAGGAASYVKVSGSSMYPTFHSGDMVMLSRRAQYHVGDIIAYHSQQLGGAVIIHRIIEITPEGSYVTKGDNNSFIDEYHPVLSDVLGERITRLPGTAKVWKALSRPLGMALLAAFGAMFIFLGRDDRASRHRYRAVRGPVS